MGEAKLRKSLGMGFKTPKTVKTSKSYLPRALKEVQAEASRFGIGFKTPKPFSVRDYVDYSTPGLEKKKIPEELEALRTELQHHPDIMIKAAAYETFEQCIGQIAADLNILLEGDYEPLALFNMLRERLEMRRGRRTLSEAELLELPGSVGLKQLSNGEIDVVSVDRNTLYDFGKSFGTIGPDQEGSGPYTICDSCNTSFDCCTARSCILGTPAVQLERTAEIIQQVVAGQSPVKKETLN